MKKTPLTVLMKTVHELNDNELNELRSRWFMEHIADGSLQEVAGKDAIEEDIPMDIVKVYYEDTFFVEEDFWCNHGEIDKHKKT